MNDNNTNLLDKAKTSVAIQRYINWLYYLRTNTATSHRVSIFSGPSSSTTRYLPWPPHGNCSVVAFPTGGSFEAQMRMLEGVGAVTVGLTSVVPMRTFDRRSPKDHNLSDIDIGIYSSFQQISHVKTNVWVNHYSQQAKRQLPGQHITALI
jgi:hypothetical protein